MHMSTSPKPSHRYVLLILTQLPNPAPLISRFFYHHTIHSHVFFFFVFVCVCFSVAGDTSTRQEDVAKSNSEEHVWLEEERASAHKPCAATSSRWTVPYPQLDEGR